MAIKRARRAIAILLGFILMSAGCRPAVSPTPVLGPAPPLPTLLPTAAATPVTPTATTVVSLTHVPAPSPTPSPTTEITPTLTPSPALKLLWRTTFSGPIGALTVSGGQVFVGIGQGSPGPEAQGGVDVGLVTALSAVNGERLWTYDLWQRPMTTTAVSLQAVGNTLFVGACEGGLECRPCASPCRVAALDMASGQEQWRYELPRDYLSPLTANAEAVAFGQGYGRALRVLETASGRERWVFTDYGTGGLPAPLIVSDTVYVYLPVGGFGEGTAVWAFDVATGKERWQTRLGGQSSGHRPVVAGGNLYVITYELGGQRLVALESATGRQRWTASPDFAQLDYRTLHADETPAGTVYAASGRLLYAFAAANGKLRWQGQIPCCGAIILGTITQAETLYVFTNTQGVYALKPADGMGLWHHDVVGEIVAFALEQGVMYLGTADGQLYALAPAE
ncbi:MAG: PQQ-like beta-propeller repeat protein [Anaerolineae bacterium]|nr:PQQ-like beta-propeller repeat protein [Anaerolineae bacterium]MDH7474000.1 PQQ-binding-like beta-propeller repeat protein [Anaerolineae bacterium]